MCNLTHPLCHNFYFLFLLDDPLLRGYILAVSNSGACQLVCMCCFTAALWVYRLRQNVIKAGIRKICLSYSRISLADVAVRLRLDSAEDAEFIVAKVRIRALYQLLIFVCVVVVVQYVIGLVSAACLVSIMPHCSHLWPWLLLLLGDCHGTHHLHVIQCPNGLSVVAYQYAWTPPPPAVADMLLTCALVSWCLLCVHRLYMMA